MHLRPDITEAAARLTSGFDVSRELRQLGAHLREGETVYRLAAGVYGSGGGLLAVTNRRVLLLRDGRTGQASEGFPLERIASVRWMGGPARGAIVIHDAHSTAELTQVESTEGASVVTFIRSLLPNELNEERDSYEELAARDEEQAGQGAQFTHGGLALAAAAAGASNGVARAVNGTATATATRTGRFAVPMKVRTPPDRAREQADSVGRVPEQKTATGRPAQSSETDGPDHGSDQDRIGSRGQVAGQDPAGDGYPDQFRGRDQLAGPEQAVGHARADERDDFAVRDRFTDREFGGRDEFADRDRFAEQKYPSRDREFGSRDGANGTGHDQSSVPGLRGVERSGGSLAGEVPVRRLAEETGGIRAATTGERDRVRRSGEFDRPEFDRPEFDRPEFDRPGFDRSELGDETGRLPQSVTGSRRGGSSGTGGRRFETNPKGATSARRSDKAGRAKPRKKWLLIGAAGVITLALVGGVLVMANGSDSTVAPAPAAVEGAGPVVKVTKVIDGDSIEVEGSVHGQVEIIGITAPRTDKAHCGAAESTGFATRTIGGSQVTLITDPSQPMTDRNGRRLASVRTENGLDYAVLAAEAGMVRYYEGTTPVAQASEIRAAQADAEKAGRGLWGPPCNGKTSTAKSSSSNSGTSSSSSNSGTSSNSGSSSGSGASSSSSNSGGTGSTSSRADSFDG